MEVVVNRKGFEKFIRAIDKAKDGIFAGSEIEITKNGMKAKIVDGGRVFLVKTWLACMGKGDATISIDTEKVLKLLKLIKDDTLTLKIDKNKLWINNNIGVGLIDSSQSQFREPELTLDITAQLDLSKLHSIVKTGMGIAECCKLIAKDGKLIIEIEGDVDIIKFELAEAQGEGKALYSLELLDNLLKGHDCAGKLEFGTDKPLRIKIDEGDFKVEYLLAPRIESD